jgi:epoxyqueuosine reductase
MTDFPAIEALLRPHQLAVMGGFTAQDDPALPKGSRTLLLIGPAEPGFWSHLTTQPEWQSGEADPIDRWSRRVIGGVACALQAKALFPFGGPPWHPFYQWALRSGRAWDSPVRLLVHDQMGLFASYRGALAFDKVLTLPLRSPKALRHMHRQTLPYRLPCSGPNWRWL